MLSFLNSVPSYIGQLRPTRLLIICLMTLGSVVSVSAQTGKDSVDLAPSDSIRGREAFGVDDPGKSRIDVDGQGRWTNISNTDTTGAATGKDSLKTDLDDPKGNAGTDSPKGDGVSDGNGDPAKGNTGTDDPKGDGTGVDPVTGSQNGRPGKGDRGNRPKADSTVTDPVDSTPVDPAESVVRKDPEKKAIDSTLSRRKLRLAGLAPPDPNVALRRSLILPGWGQLYNRSSWKVPIIYAGFGGLGYMFAFNHREYRYHKLAAICISTGSCTEYPEFDGFSQENVISIREFHRRYRDLSVIIGALWYALNGVDAYVEAHLQPFEVGDDLSLRVKPSIMPDPFQQRNVYLGASLSLGFGK